jgi:hypothetical protein
VMSAILDRGDMREVPLTKPGVRLFERSEPKRH